MQLCLSKCDSELSEGTKLPIKKLNNGMALGQEPSSERFGMIVMFLYCIHSPEDEGLRAIILNRLSSSTVISNV